MKEISATEFKAKCLALLEDVKRTGKGVTILKHGKPVARVLPPLAGETHHPQDLLRGSVEILGDVVSPPLPAAEWEAESSDRT